MTQKKISPLNKKERKRKILPLNEDYKLRKKLRKDNFYNFFRDYVKSYDEMKNEIGEIVKEYRGIPIKQARNIRIFKYPEIQKFIENNDFQELFYFK
ncbi:hypothetical protein LNI96_11180 [Tenacibaculum dicentrarchi]|nr:hypothetical protein [Tenacibaculum dicentrarchi]